LKADIIVSGGTVVAPQWVRKADLLISGGKIKAIVKPGALKSARTSRIIQAGGWLILPGVVDAHVHFQLPVGKLKTADDFESGSRAAAHGGVTTVLDYTAQEPGVPLVRGLRSRMDEARGRMHVDYSFHCIIPSWKKLKDPSGQMRRLVSLGVPTFKMFMIYEGRGLQSDDADLYQALEASGRCGATVCVHAESERVLQMLVARYRGQKTLGAMAHALSRPDFTEWEAVQRALTWGGLTRGHLYFVHLSSGRSAGLIGQALRRGIHVHGETCPQYLLLNDSVFRRPDGHLYATCPQFKKSGDSRTLWDALKNGSVSVLATDHCSFTRAQKDRWRGDFTRIPYGVPGVETLLPSIYTYGVCKGRMDLKEMVRLLCENPARLMGLYPRKGTIREGSDADLVVLNPKQKRVLDFRRLEGRCDWSPYQGWEMRGFPEYTILRGEVLVEGGEFVGRTPRGRFLLRGRWLPPLKSNKEGGKI